MAACKNGVSKMYSSSNFIPVKKFLQTGNFSKIFQRNTYFFRHLAQNKEHNETDYEYEVSKDPNEWKNVEKLLQMKTVPEPKPKSHYSSGWVPPKEEALNLSYYVRRTKNHMLPVYFLKKPLHPIAITKIKNIHGDLWGFHDDLHSHLEKKLNQKIPSMVHEGNNTINFKGDFVYYVEQWLLSKGF